MRTRVLAGWLFANAVSLTGTRVASLAMPWFVLTTTGSVGRTGLMAAAEMAPLVVAKALGGPVVDRRGARNVAVRCDVSSAVVVVAIPAAHATGMLSFGVLLGLVAVAGLLRGPGDAAKSALAPLVARATGAPLERVTGLSGAVERGAGVAGAAVAGALLTLAGATVALVVDAGSFLISAVLLAMFTGPLTGTSSRPSDPGSYRQQFVTGWDFLRRDRVLRVVAGMVAITNLLDQALLVVLLPAWARHNGQGPAAIGVLTACFSLAAVVSALAAARWGHTLPRFWVYLLGFLIAGAPRFLVLATGAPAPACVAVFVLSGGAGGLVNPVLGAVMYGRIPSELTGRVMSLISAAMWSLMPFGGVVAAGGMAWWGLGPTLLVAGGVYFVVTLAPLTVPSFRMFDQAVA